eukprot:scpid78288/ scgid11567/ 
MVVYMLKEEPGDSPGEPPKYWKTQTFEYTSHLPPIFEDDEEDEEADEEEKNSFDWGFVHDEGDHLRLRIRQHFELRIPLDSALVNYGTRDLATTFPFSHENGVKLFRAITVDFRRQADLAIVRTIIQREQRRRDLLRRLRSSVCNCIKMGETKVDTTFEHEN